MPIEIIIGRIAVTSRIEHQRNIKSSLTHYPLPITDPQQHTRRIDSGSAGKPGSHIFLIYAKPVVLRLRSQKKKRQYISPCKQSTPINKFTGPDIAVIIRIRPDRIIIEVHHYPRIQPVVKRIPDLRVDPDIEL